MSKSLSGNIFTNKTHEMKKLVSLFCCLFFHNILFLFSKKLFGCMTFTFLAFTLECGLTAIRLCAFRLFGKK